MSWLDNSYCSSCPVPKHILLQQTLEELTNRQTVLSSPLDSKLRHSALFTCACSEVFMNWLNSVICCKMVTQPSTHLSEWQSGWTCVAWGPSDARPQQTWTTFSLPGKQMHIWKRGWGIVDGKCLIVAISRDSIPKIMAVPTYCSWNCTAKKLTHITNNAHFSSHGRYKCGNLES